MHQTSFSFKNNNPYNSDEFIKSESNLLAYKTIHSWPNSVWGVNPYPKAVILKGLKSSGKTFLAKIWAAKSGALIINSLKNFNEKAIENYKAFVIEDLDHDLNEEIILHNFNIIHEHNKYLLITLSKIPDIILPDLRSRINSVNIINIDAPDDELLKIFIFKLFSDYSVVVTEEIINYLIKILPREFSSIISNIQKINEYALMHKRKITIPLIKKALNYLL